MKNVKLMLLSLTAILLLGLGTANAQESPSKTVIIRTIEGSKMMIDNAGLITTDAEGKISKVDLEKGATLEILANNGVIIQKELEKWKREGYKITNLATGGDGIFCTTIILEK